MSLRPICEHWSLICTQLEIGIYFNFADRMCRISYKKMEAFESHRTSEVYAMSQKRGAEIQLLAAAPDVKILQHVGGFASR